MPTAQRIIVGEVLGPDFDDSPGYMAGFRLQVIDVLRGPASPDGMLHVVGLRSGLPLTVCADTVVTLLRGDVVVLALDAVAPDGATRINTLAYLRRQGDSLMVDVEDITAEELVALTRLDDDSEAWPVQGAVLLGAGLLLLLASGTLLVVLVRRRNRD